MEANRCQYKLTNANVRPLRLTAARRYLGGGAARPHCGRRAAAGLLLGAAEHPLSVTWNILLHSGWPQHGPHHLALRAAAGGLVWQLLLAGPTVHVAGVALRAAMLVVVAAYGLEGEVKTISKPPDRPGPDHTLVGHPGDKGRPWPRRCCVTSSFGLHIV